MTIKFPRVIMLAEDDDDDAELFQAVVQELSAATQIRRAKDGQQLIDMLHQELPDMLFLDVLMPCKDGRQCIVEIRATPAFDQLPVIVYSTLTDSDTADFFYKNGANAYMHKPFSYQRLKTLMQRLFSDGISSIHDKPFDKFILADEPPDPAEDE